MEFRFPYVKKKAFRIVVDEKDLTKSPLAVRQVAKQNFNYPIIYQ